MLQVTNVDLSSAGKTWDDDANLDIDDDGVIIKGDNNNVNGEDEDADGSGGGDKGWDVDDGELEIPADLIAAASASSSHQDKHDERESGGFFVAPTRGTPMCQVWCNNSKLAVDHILGGSFESAMRLLHDQIGVVDFAEYKSLFMQVYARSRTCFTALPSLVPLYAYPCRTNPMQMTNAKMLLPAIGLKLGELIQR